MSQPPTTLPQSAIGNSRVSGIPDKRARATSGQKSAMGSAEPIRGWVNTFYRYYKGRKLGPYYVRRWKVGRKVHKQYISAKDVEKVRAACEAHRERQKEVKANNWKINRLLDNFNFLGAMMNRYDSRKKVSEAQEAFIVKLHSEGMYIPGKPAIRPRRRFMVPHFSNFVKFLPSGSKLQEILDKEGEEGIIRAFDTANYQSFREILMNCARTMSHPSP